MIDSECFTFAPALKGISKKAVDATQQGFQLTIQLYAGRVAALEKKIAVLEKQLKVGDGGGNGVQRLKGYTGPPGKDGAESGGGGVDVVQLQIRLCQLHDLRINSIV